MRTNIYDIDEYKGRKYNSKCVIFIKEIDEERVMVLFWGGYKIFERNEILASDGYLNGVKGVVDFQDYDKRLSNHYSKVKRKMKVIADNISQNSKSKIAIYCCLSRKYTYDDNKFQQMLIHFMTRSLESYVSDEVVIDIYKETITNEWGCYSVKNKNGEIIINVPVNDYDSSVTIQAYFENILYLTLNDDNDDSLQKDGEDNQNFLQVRDVLEKIEEVDKKTEKNNQEYIDYLNSFFEINAKNSGKRFSEFKGKFNSERKNLIGKLKHRLERVEIGESLSKNHILMLYLAYLLRMSYEETEKLFILGGEKFRPQNDCEVFFHILIKQKIYEDDERMELVINEKGYEILEEYVIDSYNKVEKSKKQNNKKEKSKKNKER